MNYQQMSDFEINKAYLEWKYGGTIKTIRLGKGGSRAIAVDDFGIASFDLNKAADAWPVIRENGIGLEKTADNKKWIARKFIGLNPLDRAIVAVDSNPLRAAMIVFLMMNEQKS